MKIRFIRIAQYRNNYTPKLEKPPVISVISDNIDLCVKCNRNKVRNGTEISVEDDDINEVREKIIKASE